MSHDHSHFRDKTQGLGLSILANIIFTIFEYGVGFVSGSLALISDATHNLTDVFALLIAYFADKISKRGSDEKRTYGYGRAKIVAALLNTLILVGLSFLLFVEAYQRILNPVYVQGGLVTIVAAIGIVINGTVALYLFRNKNDINIRSAFLHQASDAVASLGAMIAGLAIIFTGKTIFDPIISIMIGVMLLFSTWNIVKETLHILLEGVPQGIDLEKVRETILSQQHIKDVHDLHIWAISSDISALSCHVLIDNCDLKESVHIIKELKANLEKTFHIYHSTIEVEMVGCDIAH